MPNSDDRPLSKGGAQDHNRRPLSHTCTISQIDKIHDTT
jgi:hypothetical protein